MAPFPEAEIMTIKRLEVALRKMDYKLLKDGAYKLHEKFHSGHRFEYIDLLKDIFWEVTENEQIPSDVKDILCPTIEDILIESGVDLAHDAYQREEESRVSSLTSLSYTTPAQEPTQIAQEYQYQPQQELQDEMQEQIVNEYVEEINNAQQYAQNENPEREGRSNAFDVFGSQKPQQEAQTRYFTNSPFSAEPFKEFNHTPISIEPTLPVYEEPMQTSFEPLYREEIQEPSEVSYQEEPTYVVEEITYQEPTQVVSEPVLQEQYQEPTQAYSEVSYQEPVQENVYQEEQNLAQQEIVFEEPTQVIEEAIEEIKEEVKEEFSPLAQNNQQVVEEVIEEVIEQKAKPTMAIFYGQDSSEDKINNINELRKAILEEANAKKIMELISQTTLQADTNVIELQGVLEQLKNKNYENVNLITNSQSAMFSQLFSASDITYDLFEEDDCNINFQPLYGLSNLFVCEECEEKYLDTKVGIKPLVLQCPKCKKTMYPDFYAPAEGAKVNLEYYNSALVSLANSEVWLLIHPSFNDKTSSDLIEAAFRVSKCVKEVYILDKDINVRETYKYIFSKINPDVKVNIQTSALEDYLNVI